MLFARVIVGTLFLAGALLLRSSGSEDILSFRFPPIYIYAGAIYASSLLVFLFASIERLRYPLLNGLSIFDLGLVTWLVLYTGASSSPFIFLYLLIIIGAAMLGQRRGALIMTALSMALLGGALVVEFYGRLPFDFLTRAQSASNSELLVTSFYNISAFYLVGILSSYLAERLQSAGAEIDRLDEDISILKGLQERIIDNVASGLLTIDEQGRVLIVNRQAERILGVTKASVWRKSITELLPGIERKAGDEDSRLELAYPHPDGTTRFLGYSTSNIRIDADRIGSIVVFQDLTRMKELESAVKRQEKLAALGSMAAGIAHEIRNPLGSISGSLQLLRQHGSDVSEDDRQLLGIALREIDRLNGLINDFLTYARPARRAESEVPLARVVDEVLEGVRKSDDTGADVSFVNSVPDKLRLRADPNTLRQIFLNLVLNAVQAGAKRIEVTGQGDAQGVDLVMTDNGSGIAPEIQNRLFEPFFSTKSTGVGLGLAIVYRIMEEYQGSIGVQSQPGKTALTLHFPRDSSPK